MTLVRDNRGDETMSKHILLVDDDRDYLLSMEMQLKGAGYEVTRAEGVGEAKQWLAEGRPDAAIVDLMMEETDGGFALCHHIKRQDAAIPVIMVTAVTSETGMDFGTTGGGSWIKADALLAKPVRFEQLQRELDRLLK
jgi:CheY-like chemotaxis protein